MFDKVNISESNKIILVEFNRLASSIISYSYLVNVLSKKYNANVVAYRLTAKKNWIKDFARGWTAAEEMWKNRCSPPSVRLPAGGRVRAGLQLLMG